MKYISFILFLLLSMSCSQDVLAQKRNAPRRNIANPNSAPPQPDPSQQETAPQKSNSTTGDTGSVASLQETTDWLKDKVSKHAGAYLEHTNNDTITGKSRVLYEAINFDKCTLSMKRRQEVKGSAPLSPDDMEAEIMVNLNDLDPASVKVSPRDKFWRVELNTYNEKQMIEMRAPAFKELVGDPLVKENSMVIYFGNDEMAKRVARAFQHAITLCGGKVEPF